MGHDFFRVVTTARFRELLAGFAPLEAVAVQLSQARGAFLAADVRAAEDLPVCSRAAMDGYAVRAADCFSASEGQPVCLEVAGEVRIDVPAAFAVGPGQCAAIPTGGCLPQGADAVAMVEHTTALAGGVVEIHRPVAPADNAMLRGEDAAAGQVALAAGTRLRAPEIGLLAALGVAAPMVRRRPRVAILSTGDELVPVEATPRPGQVRDVNSHALAALVAEAGAEVLPLGLVADDLPALSAALQRGLDEADVLLLSGGSSVGVRDLTVAAIQALPGGTVLAHGVQMAPGKPTILADVGGRAVLGLPGQVASAQVVMLALVQPLLAHLAGDAQAFSPGRRTTRPAVLARNVPSVPGREDYVRVALEPGADGPPMAWPRLGKSGLLRTLVEAHGLIIIDAGTEGLTAGSPVEVWMI